MKNYNNLQETLTKLNDKYYLASSIMETTNKATNKESITMRISPTLRGLFLVLVLIIMASSLVSCGNNLQVIEVDKIVDNIIEIETPQQLEGRFFFTSSNYMGQIELVAAVDNRLYVINHGEQQITLRNKTNGGADYAAHFGTFPVISAPSGMIIHNGMIRFNRNVNFSDGNHFDVEHDTNGSNITGVHRVDYTIQLLDNGQIKLKIEVFSGSINNNVNFKIFTRTLRSR